METTVNIASRLILEGGAILAALALVEWGLCWYMFR
jgi:hypothetical protein